jgi:hypothetical protein
MTDHAVRTKAGPTLYAAAASAVASGVFAALFLVSVVFARLGLGALRELGAISLVGFLIGAPVAVATSLLVRCRACDRLVIPLVYDGKSFLSRQTPTAWAIGKTALDVVLHRHGKCPHCGADAQV